jgi:hypothetical protein
MAIEVYVDDATWRRLRREAEDAVEAWVHELSQATPSCPAEPDAIATAEWLESDDA